MLRCLAVLCGFFLLTLALASGEKYTFVGVRFAMTEDPRGVATRIEESVNDKKKPAGK